MEVRLHKKVLKEDPHTGRKVEFSSGLSGVVSITTGTGTSSYGIIDSLFSYKKVQFALCSKFRASQRSKDGLVHIPDMTFKQKAIFPLDALSRPLVVATTSCDNELWILSTGCTY